MNKTFLEFAEKQYFFEIDRKDKLNRSSSLPIGFSAVLAPTIIYLMNPENSSSLLIVFSIILSIFVSLILIIFYVYAFRFYVGPGFKYIESADEFSDYKDSLIEHNLKYPDSSKAIKTFRDALAKTYARSATHNQQENHIKSGALYEMNRCILIAVALTCLSGFFRILHDFTI